MKQVELRNSLTERLGRMYELEAFGSLAEFLQGELRVLYYLDRAGTRENNPSTLSEQLQVSRSRITAALSALRGKGFVTMDVSPADRRRMLVRLTAEGTAFLRSKRERVEGYFDQLVFGLGEQNVLDLIRLIDLSIRVMGATPDNKEQLS